MPVPSYSHSLPGPHGGCVFPVSFLFAPSLPSCRMSLFLLFHSYPEPTELVEKGKTENSFGCFT